MNNSIADYLITLKAPLNVIQVSQLLGVHRDTVYHWINEGTIPVLNVGASTTVLRFPTQELAGWVRERNSSFRGPARFIADWMKDQVVRAGGLRVLPPLLVKALERTQEADWLATAKRVMTDKTLAFAIPLLMSDFIQAVNQMPISEQRELLNLIKSGAIYETVFPTENAE